ncbi:MAG: translocation/assembly module TamB domain-containing protein [Desulfobulbaceae bacterium]|nr:translocation/assembly module TamB domain-containing protein [Desulfobulbaceae bacterium]
MRRLIKSLNEWLNRPLFTNWPRLLWSLNLVEKTLRYFLRACVVLAVAGVTIFSALNSGKTVSWLARGAETALPGFSVGEASGDFFSDWSLRDISWRGGDCSFSLKNLKLRWRGDQLRHGKLAIDELAADGIRLELPPGREKKPEQAPAVFTMPPIPPWLRIALARLSVHDAHIRQGGRVLFSLTDFSGSAALDEQKLSLRDWRLTGLVTAASTRMPCSLRIGAANFSAQERIARLEKGEWAIEPGRGYAPLSGTFSVAGAVAAPNVVFRIDLEQPGHIGIFGDARIGRQDQPLRWELSAKATDGIDLQTIHRDWPPLVLDMDLQVYGDNGDFHSETLSGHLVNKLDKRAARFELKFAGDPQHVELRQFVTDGDYGAFSAEGDFSWAEGFSWRGQITADQFNPAIFASDYPGSLDAILSAEGTISGQSRAGSLTMKKLSGQVRGYPVTGGGGLRFLDNTLTVDSLLLQSGAARLELDGDIAEQLDMTAELAVPNLGEALARASGALAGRATLSGALKQPRIEANLKGNSLVFADHRLARLNADVAVDMSAENSADSSVSGEIIATDARQGDKTLINLCKLNLAGSPAKHQVELTLRSPLADAALRLVGGLREKTWQGALDKVTLAGKLFGRWRQNGAARLKLAATEGELAALSLTDGDGAFRLGGGFVGEGAERRWHFSITDGVLPLALLPPVAGKKAAGRVNLHLEAAGRGAIVENGRLSIAADQAETPGIAVVPGFHRLHLTATRLDATLSGLSAQRPGGVLALVAQSRFNDDNELAANLDLAAPRRVFDLTNFGELTTAALSGTVRLTMGDLNFVGPLSHYTVIPAGAVAGEFALSGTPLQPNLTGTVSMAEGGQVEITSSGIDIEHVNIDGRIAADLADGPDLLNLNLTVHGTSGPGAATARGVLNFPRHTPFYGDFSLNGANFTIANRPEYHIRANPDVRMFFDGDHGKLTGDVAVTWAEIAPEHLADGVAASDDLIIVDDDTPEHPAWRFLTDLNIHFGETVRFSGYGLTGLLRGNLAVKTDPSDRLTGVGALQLAEADFVIYGRRLKIERGRLAFVGGAIDNPLIDARAEKRVLTSGSGAREITVGVDASGGADALEFELFSSEPLDDKEILTYLLSGTSASKDTPDESLLSSAAKALGLDDKANLLGGMGLFDEVSLERNEENNSTSLLVGKRLTDDLFIGYDHNFVGGAGAFKIRYTLGRGFTVETSSSGGISAADLFYSFEK